MSRISLASKEKIKEQILRLLYDSHPEMLWTYQIGGELIRDDEFILKLLKELYERKLVIYLRESKGNKIKRRWGMDKGIYNKYKELLK